jgi:hypothetical protein
MEFQLIYTTMLHCRETVLRPAGRQQSYIEDRHCRETVLRPAGRQSYNGTSGNGSNRTVPQTTIGQQRTNKQWDLS